MPADISRADPYTPKSGLLAGNTYTSWTAYKNDLAKAKGFTSHEQRRRKASGIRSREDLGKKGRQQQEGYRRSLHAVSLMRTQGLPLEVAAREAGTTPGTVIRHAGRNGLRKQGGRYKPTKTDKMVREMLVISVESGVVYRDVPNSRQASTLGEYHNAVKGSLISGDARHLRPFRGKVIAGETLETDLNVLREYEDAGLLDEPIGSSQPV